MAGGPLKVTILVFSHPNASGLLTHAVTWEAFKVNVTKEGSLVVDLGIRKAKVYAPGRWAEYMIEEA